MPASLASRLLAAYEQIPANIRAGIRSDWSHILFENEVTERDLRELATTFENIASSVRNACDIRANAREVAERAMPQPPLVWEGGLNLPPRTVLRPYSPPIGVGSTTNTPWCSICAGWHVPGMGPCTRNVSEAG